MSCNYNNPGTIISSSAPRMIRFNLVVKYSGVVPVIIEVKKADPFWAKHGKNKKGKRGRY